MPVGTLRSDARALWFADLSVAVQKFSQSLQEFQFECIGDAETDDEVNIGKCAHSRATLSFFEEFISRMIQTGRLGLNLLFRAWKNLLERQLNVIGCRPSTYYIIMFEQFNIGGEEKLWKKSVEIFRTTNFSLLCIFFFFAAEWALDIDSPSLSVMHV